MTTLETDAMEAIAKSHARAVQAEEISCKARAGLSRSKDLVRESQKLQAQARIVIDSIRNAAG